MELNDKLNEKINGKTSREILEKNSGRTPEIEFLRFLFASMVVLHHSRYLFGDKAYGLFIRGSFSVDFFFILSGCFLMQSVERDNLKKDAVAESTVNHLKRKVSSLYTELVTANVIGILFIFLTATAPLKDVIKRIVLSFPSDFLFLRMCLCTPAINGPIWYISSMLICMGILYPLLRRWPEIMSKVTLPIISALLLGFLWKNYHSVLDPTFWLGFTYKGNIRAFAELSIGVLTYRLAVTIKNMRLTLTGQILATYVKWFCFLPIIDWMIFNKREEFELIFLGMYAVGIALSLSEQCLDSGLFNKGICCFLGRLSTSLFISHYFFSSPDHDIANITNILPEDMNKWAVLVIYYVLALCTAFAVMHIAGSIRKNDIKRRVISKLIV